MQHINNTPADSGLGDTLKVAFDKVNANFQELVAIDSSFSGDIQTLNTIISDGSTLNHTHTISQIIGLQTALSGKVSTSTFNTQILAINSSIQAINSTLSDIIDILNTKIGDAPFSGITYGRKDGQWVQISGGTTDLSGYVPYTGATQNVILGPNNISSERGFIIPTSTIGGFNVSYDPNYLQFGFSSVDISDDNFGSSFFFADAEQGIQFYKTRSVSSEYGSIQLNQIESRTTIENSALGLNNTFIVGLNEVSTNQTMIASKGFISSPFPGNVNNIFELGTNYINDNYKQIRFANYGDGIEFPTEKNIVINANIEEGIGFSLSDTGDSYGQFSLGAGSLSINIGQSGIGNAIDVANTQTQFGKKVVTQEGFEGNYVQFNTAATETNAVGKMKWNDQDGTVDLGLKGGNVQLQIGQESVVRVVNKAGEDLLESAYQAVRVTGAQGNRLKIDLALATDDLNSAETIGIVTETILDNQEGFVTTNGLVRNINTTGSIQGETWADGDILYLSPVSAGGLTNIKPSAPQHMVVMGYVVRAHSTQGQIFVKVNNGYELDELHNVNVSGATTGDTLMYNGSVWQNVNPFDYFDAKSIKYAKSVNLPSFGGASLNNVEGAAAANGGATARTFNDSTPLRATPRMGLVGTVTGNVGGSTRLPNSTFSMTTGFDCLSGFNMAENATSTGIRFFLGIRGTTGVFTNVEPDTLINVIGFARLSTSDNLFLIHNDATGIATTIDLGTDFPANTFNQDRYFFTIKTVPTGVFVKIVRPDAGKSYSTTITTDLPLAGTALSFGGFICATTGANTNTGFDFYGAHITHQYNNI